MLLCYLSRCPAWWGRYAESSPLSSRVKSRGPTAYLLQAILPRLSLGICQHLVHTSVFSGGILDVQRQTNPALAPELTAEQPTFRTDTWPLATPTRNAGDQEPGQPPRATLARGRAQILAEINPQLPWLQGELLGSQHV